MCWLVKISHIYLILTDYSPTDITFFVTFRLHLEGKLIVQADGVGHHMVLGTCSLEKHTVKSVTHPLEVLSLLCIHLPPYHWKNAVKAP